MAITITVANQKGGVGKTTTAVTLAHALAIHDHQTLLVDMDPQGQCATFLGVPQEPGASVLLSRGQSPVQLARQVRRNLFLLPGDKSTAEADFSLSRDISYLRQLLNLIQKNDLRYIIIDTAPSVSNIQGMALWASDLVLVPTACDYASSQGIIDLHETLTQLQGKYEWKGKLLGVLPTFYDRVTKETRRTMAELEPLFKEALLPPISRATILRECAAEGRTIFEVDPYSRASKEYQRLYRHVYRVTA